MKLSRIVARTPNDAFCLHNTLCFQQLLQCSSRYVLQRAWWIAKSSRLLDYTLDFMTRNAHYLGSRISWMAFYPLLRTWAGCILWNWLPLIWKSASKGKGKYIFRCWFGRAQVHHMLDLHPCPWAYWTGWHTSLPTSAQIFRSLALLLDPGMGAKWQAKK